MLLVTRLPHQSDLVQVELPTTGRRACCRMSAIGPPALGENGAFGFRLYQTLSIPKLASQGPVST